MYDQYKHNDCNESLKNELISTLPVQGMSRAKPSFLFYHFRERLYMSGVVMVGFLPA